MQKSLQTVAFFQLRHRFTIGFCQRNSFQLTLRHVHNGAPVQNNKGFFGKFVESLKQEFEGDKEMKENLKKFRQKAKELEESEALKKAREKFETIESETNKGSQQFYEQVSVLKGKLNQTLEEAKKSDLGKKGGQVAEEFASQAKNVKESILKQTTQLGQNPTINVVKQSVKQIKEEVEGSTLAGPQLYRPPIKLRKRNEYSVFSEERPVEANTDATGVELHKDSKWHKSWSEFKENNAYVNKIFELKAKYDESDNTVVRASKLFSEKIGDLFGNLFSTTELSEVLTEICKVDPNFDKNEFIKFCETDVIPNILEAIVRGDLEILQDWCHEVTFNALAHPIKQAIEKSWFPSSRVIDIENVELAMGKMMEQGPVLVITFQAQQILAFKDKDGKLVEGDLNKIHRVHYVWALCRDQNEFDPRAAWKLADISASSTEQWV